MHSNDVRVGASATHGGKSVRGSTTRRSGRGSLWPRYARFANLSYPAAKRRFAVAPGKFVAIIGPSGSGKSTILNLSAGIDMPSAGSASYDGGRVTGVTRTIGYLTQHDSLLPWRNIADDIAVPLEIRKMPAAERSRVVQDMLATVGLGGYGGHYPRQLSGGMRKRAMLARALIYDPKAILMDEPFGPLDAMLKLTLQAELLRLWSGTGQTIVFVTHDIAESITLSDRVLVLSAQPTRIKHIEAIRIPPTAGRPRSPVFAAFRNPLPRPLERARNAARGCAGMSTAAMIPVVDGVAPQIAETVSAPARDRVALYRIIVAALFLAPWQGASARPPGA